MFSRRPGTRFNRGRIARRSATAAPSVWRPYGYGSTLLLDWIVGDGAEFLDFGLGGVARIRDQSGTECHGTQLTSAVLQPVVDPNGVDNKPALFFDRALGNRLTIGGPIAVALSGTNQPVYAALYGAVPTGRTVTNGCFFSCSHSTGSASLQIHWPKDTSLAGPGGRTVCVRTNDSAASNQRGASPDATTAQRLLRVGASGSTMSGALGASPATMAPLVWGGTVAAPGLCTFDRSTFGAASEAGATPWSGWMRRFSVWSAEPPAEALAEWDEMVTL